MHNIVRDQIKALLADHPATPAKIEQRRDLLRNCLLEMQPYDFAVILHEFSEPQQVELLTVSSPEMAAAALEHMDYYDQYRLLDRVAGDTAKAVLARMPLHHIVDLVRALHPLQGEVLLDLIPKEQRHRIDQVQVLPDDATGRRMTVGYLEVRADWTSAQIIDHIRKVGRGADVANYVYVVDNKGRLVGVASMRDVLLSPEQMPVSEVMNAKLISIGPEASQEDAARVLNRYDFTALPVVDSSQRIVGVVNADDIMDVMEEEATKDIQQLGGSAPLDTPYLKTTIFSLFRSRVGWLLVLFVAESFTGTILRNFEDALEQVVALAFFIPLLLDTGGNTGSQASTLVTRAIALGEVTIKQFFTVVWREARVSMALALVMAVAAYFRALMLGESMMLGLTVAITIGLIVIIGTTVGAALPLIGRRLGVDPAVFSAPLITTVADGLGLYIYFQVAVRLLHLA